MKKRILKSLALLLSLLGAGLVGYPFFVSLAPGSNTKDPGFLVVNLAELGRDKPKIFEYNKYPVLVLMYFNSENKQSVKAYIGVPKFSDSLTIGCGVRPVGDYPNANAISPAAVFYEPCRGVYYDLFGEVLTGSHPNARQLHPVKLKVVGSKVYIGKFT